MEISKALAERKLKEHNGNVVEALVELTNWWPYYWRAYSRLVYNYLIYMHNAINDKT